MRRSRIRSISACPRKSKIPAIPHISHNLATGIEKIQTDTILISAGPRGQGNALAASRFSVLPRAENFRVRGEHSLLRECVNNSFAVLDAQRAALFRISKQDRDRRGKGWTIVTRNDEGAIILTHHGLNISDIYRRDGSARRHRLEQCIWHLFCIGRQSE